MYGIFTYIYHENQQNVGKSYMDGMGNAPNPVRIKHVNLWAYKLLSFFSNHWDIFAGSYRMANYYFPKPPWMSLKMGPLSTGLPGSSSNPFFFQGVVFCCCSFRGGVVHTSHKTPKNPSKKVECFRERVLKATLGHLEQLYLGDLLTMVISHLLNGMILQVMVFFLRVIWKNLMDEFKAFLGGFLLNLGWLLGAFGHPVVCPNRWRFELLFQLPYSHTSFLWSMFRIIHQGTTDSSNEVVNNIYNNTVGVSPKSDWAVETSFCGNPYTKKNNIFNIYIYTESRRSPGFLNQLGIPHRYDFCPQGQGISFWQDSFSALWCLLVCFFEACLAYVLLFWGDVFGRTASPLYYDVEAFLAEVLLFCINTCNKHWNVQHIFLNVRTQKQMQQGASTHLACVSMFASICLICAAYLLHAKIKST